MKIRASNEVIYYLLEYINRPTLLVYLLNYVCFITKYWKRQSFFFSFFV